MNLCFWGIDLASVSAICLLDFAISLFNFFFNLYLHLIPNARLQLSFMIITLSIPLYVRCISVLVIKCANFCQRNELNPLEFDIAKIIWMDLYIRDWKATSRYPKYRHEIWEKCSKLSLKRDLTEIASAPSLT